MTFVRKHLKLIGVAASCAAIGAGASAIASAGAASTSSQAKNVRSVDARRGLRRALARTVHGDLVVATKAGFATVTVDRGFVQSLSGQQLSLREGTRKTTYKTVTLTLPAGALVRENGKKATPADVKQGQHALVLQAPKRTLLIVRDVRTD